MAVIANEKARLSIPMMLEESRNAARAGAFHAAFLLTWETAEAALKEATGLEKLPASVLISNAFNHGFVDQLEYFFLLRLSRERSLIAHGIQELIAEEISSLAELAERLVSPKEQSEESLSPMPVHEVVGGESYDYFPIGEHVVRAVGVCGGRPTFKYTRIEPAGLLQRLVAGEAFDELVRKFEGSVPAEALQEAIDISSHALLNSTRMLPIK